MAYTLDDKLVVAVTSRALFDLDDEDRVYREQGLDAYRAYQRERESVPLSSGTAQPLIKGLLRINTAARDRLVEVVLVSKNDADSSLRIFNSIQAAGLDVTRSALTGGRPPYAYLQSFSCDLFLSANPEDVSGALTAGFAAALVYPPPTPYPHDIAEVRIAFDGDAVLFGDTSERYFQNNGLEAYLRREAAMSDVPLEAGPFKGFITALVAVQKRFPEKACPLRTALITARNAPAHQRVINTLRAWGVRVDELFFLGGIEKKCILDVFRPHIFFDDQRSNLDPAALTTPSAHVLSAPESPGAGSVTNVKSISEMREEPWRRLQ